MEDIVLSIIVPIYNVEKYLIECLNSLLNIEIHNKEIILVDDGSTDSSGLIADRFAATSNDVKVIHQSNNGLSCARNRGLDEVTGDYIIFIDSDDWLIPGTMELLYKIILENNVDIILGNALFITDKGYQYNPFNKIPDHFINSKYSGKQTFVNLMKYGALQPMVGTKIYRKTWLDTHKLLFVDVLHEDELWTPIAFCKAESIYITDIDFYGYRQREGSIMNTLKKRKRITDLLYISNHLIYFAENLKCNSIEDHEAKSWLYVKVFSLYSLAFSLLYKMNNSDYILPTHHLYYYLKLNRLISIDARLQCLYHYKLARINLKQYLKWKIQSCECNIKYQNVYSKKIFLVYNKMWDTPLEIPIQDIPANIFFTTDRKYINEADVIIFHLPNLYSELEEDLNKPDGQIWVAWYCECVENYEYLKDAELMSLFDYKMSYKTDADIFIAGISAELLNKSINSQNTIKKDKSICMMISSGFNQSHRKEYLEELTKYIQIDSYGHFMNNMKLENDLGRISKLQLYSKYKFIISFENAIGIDYVTEKFYDPLWAGSVPVYLGAPNIESFVPGNDCFVDIRKFDSPRKLADYLIVCCENEVLYSKYTYWRNYPLHSSFTNCVISQKIHPFIRLANLLVNELKWY